MPVPDAAGDARMRMGQYGTKHPHAPGVLATMLDDDRVRVEGVYEPDPARRDALSQSGAEPWRRVRRWYDKADQMLADPAVTAVAAEGLAHESLGHARAVVEAGKHLWYDKPAGDSYGEFAEVVDTARRRGLHIQLGYMFRYHDGFRRIASWARTGLLGEVYSVRAQMSTDLDGPARSALARYPGGILFDLGGHMIDQIVWLLGRPRRSTAYLRQGTAGTAGFADNAVAVLEYADALATIDISAMEPRPCARRFEVYGTEGSAIMEPFEPADDVRLCLRRPRGGYPEGVTRVPVTTGPRYAGSLQAFVQTVRGERSPDRGLDHELAVQETLLELTAR